ncbi:Aminotransferase-like mobile domain-containing protein [Senna tora]|uniref:Aminotransferase-like mobile domain-containing protein n=1 Tax=Senna tora TaxID=362788 RepID=A0A834SUB7_9FABA|nr:Aminotransferase-like mobile domain-containing protein [Senna tora]
MSHLKLVQIWADKRFPTLHPHPRKVLVQNLHHENDYGSPFEGSLYTKKYLPHCVSMQFGLDQDILGQVDFRYKDEIIVDPYKAAWTNYSMPIIDTMLLDVVVASSSISVPCFTLKYVEWWNQSNLGMGEKPGKDDSEVRSQSDSVHENGDSSMAYNGVEMIDLAKRSNEIVNVVGGGGLKRERVDMATKLETLIGKLQGDIFN